MYAWGWPWLATGMIAVLLRPVIARKRIRPKSLGKSLGSRWEVVEEPFEAVGTRWELLGPAARQLLSHCRAGESLKVGEMERIGVLGCLAAFLGVDPRRPLCFTWNVQTPAMETSPLSRYSHLQGNRATAPHTGVRFSWREPCLLPLKRTPDASRTRPQKHDKRPAPQGQQRQLQPKPKRSANSYSYRKFRSRLGSHKYGANSIGPPCGGRSLSPDSGANRWQTGRSSLKSRGSKGG